MDLNLNALIGAAYLIPIAITLRRVYTPSFEMPESFSLLVAKIDAKTSHRQAQSHAMHRRELLDA